MKMFDYVVTQIQASHAPLFLYLFQRNREDIGLYYPSLSISLSLLPLRKANLVSDVWSSAQGSIILETDLLDDNLSTSFLTHLILGYLDTIWTLSRWPNYNFLIALSTILKHDSGQILFLYFPFNPTNLSLNFYSISILYLALMFMLQLSYASVS